MTHECYFSLDNPIIETDLENLKWALICQIVIMSQQGNLIQNNNETKHCYFTIHLKSNTVLKKGNHPRPAQVECRPVEDVCILLYKSCSWQTLG